MLQNSLQGTVISTTAWKLQQAVVVLEGSVRGILASRMAMGLVLGMVMSDPFQVGDSLLGNYRSQNNLIHGAVIARKIT